LTEHLFYDLLGVKGKRSMPLETTHTPTLTPEILSSIAGVLLSLLASYLPGFSTWFDRLPATHKRLLMLGLLATVTAAIVGLACAGLGQPLGAACNRGSVTLALQSFILALVANQSAYLISRG
jgi:hypothetical protein